DAIGVIVGDRFEAGVGGPGVMRVADDDVVGREMIEEGGEAVLEQGEPMLHPREAAAFGDSLIERVASRRCAELLAVAAAEALDALGVEQRFGGGEEGEAFVEAADGALVLRVELADAFDLVAEEIE